MKAAAFLHLVRADLRAAELRLMAVALVLAAMALSSVGFVAQRLDAALQRDAATLLGGDLVVRSDRSLDAAFAARARGLGLRTTTSAMFPSVALGPGAGGRTRLVIVKAVDRDYPLLGQLELRGTGGSGGTTAAPRGGPPPGSAWVAPGVAEALGAPAAGPIRLGRSSLRIAGVIAAEPDRGALPLELAPRVIIAAADLPATDLIQPASRVTWTLALSGPSRALEAWRAWAAPRLGQLRGAHLERAADGRIGDDLRRGAAYLQLVALLSALLAAVATALAARDFARRRLDTTALLRALGLRRRTVLALLLVELGLLGGGAALLGSALGLLGQAALLRLLGGLVRLHDLPAPGWQPAALALLTTLALLAAFALPPVLRLAGVPPLRVLRREVQGAGHGWLVGALGLAAWLATLLLATPDRRLGAIALGGFAAAGVVVALLAALLVRGLRRVGGNGVWGLAARQLGSRGAQSVAQVSALALALLALFLVAMLRDGLLAGWQAALPADAPNRFVINVQPEQAEAFRHALRAGGVARYDWYPMVRGRLVAIDGRPVRGADYADARARALVEREFNLSTSPTLPPGNRVVAGRWDPARADGLSVESGLAQTLGLKLGDRLRFDVAGSPLAGTITSLRRLDWGSMRVNFFVLMPASMLRDAPPTYITAFRAPAPAAALDTALVRAFPDITLIDVDDLLAQLRRALDRLARAVQLLFALALGGGLTVLVAALLLSRQERAQEAALWRVLGASGRLLRRVAAAELVLAGALAGLLGSAAAALIARELAARVFEFAWNPGPGWLLAGVAAGALLALGVGWLALRPVLRAPPLGTLRAAA